MDCCGTNGDGGTARSRANDLTLAGPIADSDWRKTLTHFPGANVFHTEEWAQVLAETYGYQRHCFTGTRSDDPKQALSLFEIDSWLTGRRAVSVPFSDECPALGVGSTGDLHQLLEKVADFGRERKWKSIELRGVPADYQGNCVANFYSHELDLTNDVAEVSERFDPSVRRAIRKAEKLGLQTEIREDLEGIEQYFELHCLTRRKHRVPPQPLIFFQNIYRHIIARGMGFTVLARLNREVLAGAVFLHFREKGLYKFGASNPATDQFRPSNLVMWMGIQASAAKKLKNLSLGRTSIGQEGLRRYKLGWGSTERRISYVKLDVRSRTYASETGSAQSNWLFGKLPIPLLKRAGALLYPHVG